MESDVNMSRYYAEFTLKEDRERDGTPESVIILQVLSAAETEKKAEERLMEYMGYVKEKTAD